MSQYGVQGSDGEEDSVYQEPVHGSDDEKRGQRDYSRFSTPSGSPEIDAIDSPKQSDDDELAESVVDVPPASTSEADSADELGGWDHDEGTTLYSVDDIDKEHAKSEERGMTEAGAASVTPEPRCRSRKKSILANTEKIVSPDKHKTSGRNWKSPQKKNTAPSPSPSITQLQTPPRSASFGPEARNAKITATYSRKRRGISSSPKRAPNRIQSTTSEGSPSEAEEPTPSKSRKQNQSVSPNTSPTKKVKLIPEVCIDVPPLFPSKKAPKVKSTNGVNDNDSSSKYQSASRNRTAKSKGKAKEIDAGQRTSYHSAAEPEPSPPLEDFEDSPSSYVRESEDFTRAGSSRKVTAASSVSAKRRRGHSPVLEGFNDTKTVDVVMDSPTSSPVRSTSRRGSASRRRIIRDVDSYGMFPAPPFPVPSHLHSQMNLSTTRVHGPQAEDARVRDCLKGKRLMPLLTRVLCPNSATSHSHLSTSHKLDIRTIHCLIILHL